MNESNIKSSTYSLLFFKHFFNKIFEKFRLPKYSPSNQKQYLV